MCPRYTDIGWFIIFDGSTEVIAENFLIGFDDASP